MIWPLVQQSLAKPLLERVLMLDRCLDGSKERE
jgi:hypothetical protein